MNEGVIKTIAISRKNSLHTHRTRLIILIYFTDLNTENSLYTLVCIHIWGRILVKMPGEQYTHVSIFETKLPCVVNWTLYGDNISMEHPWGKRGTGRGDERAYWRCGGSFVSASRKGAANFARGTRLPANWRRISSAGPHGTGTRAPKDSRPQRVTSDVHRCRRIYLLANVRPNDIYCAFKAERCV